MKRSRLMLPVILMCTLVLCACAQKEIILPFEFDDFKGEVEVTYTKVEWDEESQANLLKIGTGEVSIGPGVEGVYEKMHVADKDGNEYPLKIIMVYIEYGKDGKLTPVPQLRFEVPENSKPSQFTLFIDNPGGTYSVQLHNIKRS